MLEEMGQPLPSGGFVCRSNLEPCLIREDRSRRINDNGNSQTICENELIDNEIANEWDWFESAIGGRTQETFRFG